MSTEVLPCTPGDVLVESHQYQEPSPLCVHSRRHRLVRAPSSTSPHGAASTPSNKHLQSPNLWEMLLPRSVIHKRKKKALPPGYAPQRSRHIMGARRPFPRASGQRSKSVSRSLGFSDNERISPRAQDDYFKLFEK